MTEPREDYAAEIHDKAYELVQADDVLNGYFKNFRLTPMLALDPAKLPNLSVYLLRDAMQADGDNNAGQPSFLHNVHLGFSGGILANSEDKHLLKLRNVMTRMLQVLLKNTSFIALIEGVVSADMRYVFSRIGEQPLSEYQLELVVNFRSDWPPDVPNDFDGVTITGAPWPNPGFANPVVRSVTLPGTHGTDSGEQT